MEKKFGFNKNNTLVVNPCINMYNKNDPFYASAQSFINHPLPFYVDVIIVKIIVKIYDLNTNFNS